MNKIFDQPDLLSVWLVNGFFGTAVLLQAVCIPILITFAHDYTTTEGLQRYRVWIRRLTTSSIGFMLFGFVIVLLDPKGYLVIIFSFALLVFLIFFRRNTRALETLY